MRTAGAIPANRLFTGNIAPSRGAAVMVDVVGGAEMPGSIDLVSCTVTRNWVATPRVFDDPDVLGLTGATLDIGCAEEQGFANGFVPAFAGSILTGDVVVDRLVVLGPSNVQSWTPLSGASRTGTVEAAFLPGWSDRVTRLVYNIAQRHRTARVESRGNVIALSRPSGSPSRAPPPPPPWAGCSPRRTRSRTSRWWCPILWTRRRRGAPHVLVNLGAAAAAWNGYAAVTIAKATGPWVTSAHPPRPSPPASAPTSTATAR